MQNISIAANAIELGLVAFGWFLLWRLCFSKEARTPGRYPVVLKFWDLRLSDFAAAALCVCCGWLLALFVFGWVLQRYSSIKSDEILSSIFGGSISQLGFLLGAAAAWYYLKNIVAPRQTVNDAPSHPIETSRYRLWPSALATTVITISLVHPVQWLWKQLLILCHLPTADQDIVALFSRVKSPWQIVALGLVAVVLAPVMEELVFRGGLYRFVRGRLPRWVALGLPALIFASLHVNRETLEGLVTVAPLTAFGIIFSLAYERTGRIAVVMLAHALFNLHTLVFLLLGLTG